MIVLLPNCGFLSETSRMLAIAQALQSRGEAVAIATHGGAYTRVLDDAGLPWTLLPPVMDAERSARYLHDLVRIGKPGVRLQSADEVRRSVAAEVDFFRQVGARAVVIGFTLTAYLSSRVAGLPLVTSHGASFVPPVFERNLAPVPTTMPMPNMEWLPSWLKRRMANAGPTRLTDPTVFLNTVAAELDVEPVPTLAALMVGDLTLVTDVPEVLGIPSTELEAWRPRRPGVYRPGTRLVYTGPLFARLDLPIPAAAQAFLDGREPTALVVLSSTSVQMLRAVTARVRAAGLRVIVGATVHDYGPVTDPGVAVAGLLPNHQVMPQVQVAVTMGGQGTVQTAMCSGTPLVGLPLHSEQEMNVDLAARHGMAVAVSPRHADSPRLTHAVQRVLQDRRFAEAARKVQGWYAGVDGAGRAADAIRRYLAQSAQGAPAAQAELGEKAA